MPTTPVSVSFVKCRGHPVIKGSLGTTVKCEVRAYIPAYVYTYIHTYISPAVFMIAGHEVVGPLQPYLQPES